jgi:hypothetical protein
MRHATPAALEELAPLLARVRELPGIVEKRPSVFYRRSKAFLHFHEDPTGLYADVRLGEDFERCRVQTQAEQAALVERLGAALSPRR